MKEEFVVEKTGSCKKVFIPREYCTIYLQNQSKDHIETSTSGDDICIENLASDLPCQKVVIDNTRKNRKMNKAILIIMLLCFPTFVFATKYYFSNSGFDNYKCAKDNPCETMDKLNKLHLKARDIVYFKAGDNFTINTFDYSGEANLTLTSYGEGERPRLISSLNVSDISWSYNFYYKANPPYLTNYEENIFDWIYRFFKEKRWNYN